MRYSVSGADAQKILRCVLFWWAFLLMHRCHVRSVNGFSGLFAYFLSVFRHISLFLFSCCNLPSEFTIVPGQIPHRNPPWSLVSELWPKWVSQNVGFYSLLHFVKEIGLLPSSQYKRLSSLQLNKKKQVRFLQSWRAMTSKQFWTLWRTLWEGKMILVFLFSKFQNLFILNCISNCNIAYNTLTPLGKILQGWV